MSHAISLVIFTILGQCAAGMMILLCFRRGDNAVFAWIAAGILVLAALASLGHLADPWISYRTLANVGSSWLSREILGCIVFGAAILAYAIFGERWLCWLAACLGVVFVYVMSRVYEIPTEPAWNTPLTFWNFLACGLLLGATIILLVSELRYNEPDCPRALLGNWPLVIMGAIAASAIFLVWQMFISGQAAGYSQIICIICLVGGGGLGIMAIGRHASRLAISGGEVAARATGGLVAATVFVIALIWCAECFGRYSFYQSYTWFGM